MEQITIKSPNATYEITISSHFNVILGDSGIGKTFLCTLVDSNQPVVKKSHSNLVLIDNKTWYKVKHQNLNDKIYFVDEDFDLLNSNEFSDFVLNNQSMFIVISRETFDKIPYGVNDVFVLSGHGRLRKNVPAYDFSLFCDGKNKASCLIEDSTTGFTFFSNLLDNVRTSYGKTSFLEYLKKSSADEILLIFDYCGFGSNVDELNEYLKYECKKKVSILPYESFEEYILGALGQNLSVPDNEVNKEVWYEEQLKRFTRFSTMRVYKKEKKYPCFTVCTQIKCSLRDSEECYQNNTAKMMHQQSKYRKYIN